MGGEGSRFRWIRPVLAPLVIATVVVVQQAVLLIGWFRLETNEDFTLLWAAARSWGGLQMRQPNFWGQSYGTTFEAIPVEVLRAVGVGPGLGLPLVIAVAHVASWWIPATVAWRRGRRVLACLAFGAPVLLTTEYVIAASVYSVIVGRVLAACAAALILAWPSRRIPVAVAAGLALLAVQFDASTVLLTLPACVYGVLTLLVASRRRLLDLGALVLAAVPGLLWYAYTVRWYRRHPTDALHKAPSFTPSLHLLGDNLGHPARLFGHFGPELLRWPALVLVVIAFVVVRNLATGRLPLVMASVGFVVALLFAASIPKSTDELPTVYFLAARTVLALPLGLWFLLAIGPPLRWSARASRLALAAVVALTVVTGTVRLVTWDSRGAPMRRAAERARMYPLTKVSRIERLCSEVRDAARATGAQFAFYRERTRAYACSGLLGDEVTSVFPEYERRSWLLRAAARPARGSVLVVGARPPACVDGTLACRNLPHGITVVPITGGSPLATASRAGFFVRPF